MQCFEITFEMGGTNALFVIDLGLSKYYLTNANLIASVILIMRFI